jgi:hypothetical protein
MTNLHIVQISINQIRVGENSVKLDYTDIGYSELAQDRVRLSGFVMTLKEFIC